MTDAASAYGLSAEERLATLRRNLAALRARDSQMASQVAAAQPPPKTRILYSRACPPRLETTNRIGRLIQLHAEDPLAGPRQRWADIRPDRLTGCIFLGFGLGYWVEEFLARAGRGGLAAVIERDPGLLRAAMEARDLTGLFDDPRVHWLLGLQPQQVYRRLRGLQNDLMMTDLRVFGDGAVMTADADYYATMRSTVADFEQSSSIALNAEWALTAKVWSNQIANAAKYAGAPRLIEMRPRYEGRPGVVVGAGPSMPVSLSALREHGGRAVIVACDVVVRPLLAAGIVPDFAAMVDYQPVMTSFLADLPAGLTTRLVAIPGANHQAVANWPGPLCFQGDAKLDLLLEQDQMVARHYECGNNVGHLCYQIALVLGLRPIALTGFDFGYPFNVRHCSGSALFEEFQGQRNRFWTMEMMSAENQLRKRGKLVKVRDWADREIYSERSMQFYLKEMEALIVQGRVETVDCSLGARKAGAEHQTMEEFLRGCAA